MTEASADPAATQTQVDPASDTAAASADSNVEKIATKTGEAKEDVKADADPAVVEDKGAEGDEDKDKDKDKEPSAPETYEDFKVPDGLVLDKAMVEKAAPVFKELNLPQESAQRIVDLYAEQVAQKTKETSEFWVNQLAAWKAESKADKEIGGDSYEKNLNYALKGVEAIGSPELIGLLDQYGISSNVHFIKFAINAGKLVSEDVIEPSGGGGSGEESVEQRWYGPR